MKILVTFLTFSYLWASCCALRGKYDFFSHKHSTYEEKNLATMEINPSSLPIMKSPYTIQSFTKYFRIICPGCFVMERTLKDAAINHPAHFLNYLFLYEKQLKGVMTKKMAEILSEVLLIIINKYKFRGFSHYLYKQLGPAAIPAFAKIFNTIWSFQPKRYLDLHYGNTICTTYDIMKHFQLTDFALENWLWVWNRLNHYDGYDTCSKKLYKLIVQRLELLTGEKFDEDLLHNYKKRIEKNRIRIELRSSSSSTFQFKPLYPRLLSETITPMEYYGEMCYRREQDWVHLEVTIVSCSKVTMSTTAVTGNIRAGNPISDNSITLTPSTVSRSNNSLREIYLEERNWRRNEVLRTAGIKEKRCPLLQIEELFQDFVLTGTYKDFDECSIFKFCLEKPSNTYFWSPIYQRRVSIDEAESIMCNSEMTIVEAEGSYHSQYGALIMTEGQDTEKPPHSFPSAVELVSHLKNIHLMGRYIAECVQYDILEGIKALVYKDFTVADILLYNEKHFFIYDASPRMLLFFINNVDFSTLGLSATSLYQLWEQILSTVKSFDAKQENHFVHSLLSHPSVQLIIQDEPVRAVLERTLLKLCPSLKYFNVKKLIIQNLFAKSD